MSDPLCKLLAMAISFDDLASAAAEEAQKTDSCVDKPTADDVKRLLEQTFFASLAREEGRSVRVRVGFVEPSGPRRPVQPSWGWWVLPFEHERPLQKGELVKLAPAVDSRQALIGVRRVDEKLVIWGLLNQGSSMANLREGMSSRASSIGPDFLEVQASAPGVLRVQVGFWSRRFADGKIDEPCFYPFHPHGSLDDVLQRATAVMSPGVWNRTLRLLLREMQRAGHGGAIFLRDADEPSRADGTLKIKYPVRGPGLVLTDACHRLAQAEDAYNRDLARMTLDGASVPGIAPEEYPPHSREDAHRLLIQMDADPNGQWLDAVHWVASLAGVDGALLLSGTFAVSAFGAMVETKQAEVVEASGRPESEWTPFPWDQFGARHQSAVSYCATHKTSAAVVVSQDGGITLFRWCRGRVVMWRPCSIDDPEPVAVAAQSPLDVEHLAEHPTAERA